LQKNQGRAWWCGDIFLFTAFFMLRRMRKESEKQGKIPPQIAVSLVVASFINEGTFIP